MPPPSKRRRASRLNLMKRKDNLARAASNVGLNNVPDVPPGCSNPSDSLAGTSNSRNDETGNANSTGNIKVKPQLYRKKANVCKRRTPSERTRRGIRRSERIERIQKSYQKKKHVNKINSDHQASGLPASTLFASALPAGRSNSSNEETENKKKYVKITIPASALPASTLPVLSLPGWRSNSTNEETRNIDYSRKIHVKYRLLRCKECEMIFLLDSMLLEHIKDHHPESYQYRALKFRPSERITRSEISYEKREYVKKASSGSALLASAHETSTLEASTHEASAHEALAHEASAHEASVHEASVHEASALPAGRSDSTNEETGNANSLRKIHAKYRVQRCAACEMKFCLPSKLLEHIKNYHPESYEYECRRIKISHSESIAQSQISYEKRKCVQKTSSGSALSASGHESSTLPASVHEASTLPASVHEASTLPALTLPASALLAGRSNSTNEETGNANSSRKTHVKYRERNQLILRCEECKMIFLLHSNLLEHIKNNHRYRYECHECGLIFMTTSSLENHMSNHGLSRFEPSRIVLNCDPEFPLTGGLGNVNRENETDIHIVLNSSPTEVQDNIREVVFDDDMDVTIIPIESSRTVPESLDKAQIAPATHNPIVTEITEGNQEPKDAGCTSPLSVDVESDMDIDLNFSPNEVQSDIDIDVNFSPNEVQGDIREVVSDGDTGVKIIPIENIGTVSESLNNAQSPSNVAPIPTVTENTEGQESNDQDQGCRSPLNVSVTNSIYPLSVQTLPNRETPSTTQLHKRVQSQPGQRDPVECKICKTVFHTLSGLERHAEIHRRRGETGFKRPVDGPEGSKFKCQWCPQTFKYSHSLKSHVKRMHVPPLEKQGFFTCKACDRKFLHKNSYTNHLKSHSHSEDNNRPFKCSICNSGFKLNFALRRHMLLRHQHQRNRSKPENPTSKTDVTMIPLESIGIGTISESRNNAQIAPNSPNSMVTENTEGNQEPKDPECVSPLSVKQEDEADIDIDLKFTPTEVLDNIREVVSENTERERQGSTSPINVSETKSICPLSVEMILSQKTIKIEPDEEFLTSHVEPEFTSNEDFVNVKEEDCLIDLKIIPIESILGNTSKGHNGQLDRNGTYVSGRTENSVCGPRPEISGYTNPVVEAAPGHSDLKIIPIESILRAALNGHNDQLHPNLTHVTELTENSACGPRSETSGYTNPVVEAATGHNDLKIIPIESILGAASKGHNGQLHPNITCFSAPTKNTSCYPKPKISEYTSSVVDPAPDPDCNVELKIIPIESILGTASKANNGFV